MIQFKFYIVNCLVLIYLVNSSAYAQSDSIEQDSTAKIKLSTPRYIISAGFEANYGSTNLSNEFIQKLLFGGKIENSLKEKVMDKTNKRNRFGVEVNYDIRFVDFTDTLFKKLPNYRYYIGFSSYNNLSASYTKDLFSTVFYGNKQFENQTASLGRSNFTSYKFEKITIGLIKSDWSHSFGLSLIIGDRYNGYNFKKADMFTHPEGTQITVDYEGKIRLSDPNRGSFMAFSGAGIGLDYSTSLLNKNYTFSVTNFGVSFWQRNTSYSNTEIVYEFEGVEIDNVLQTSSDEIETKAKEILPELRTRGFITMLPTIIRLDKNLNAKKQFQPIYGVRYKFFSNYLPSVYGGMSYQASSKLRISGNLAWGGYAGLRGGLGAYYTAKKFIGGIETSNLTGIFLKSGNGNGVSIFGSFHF